MRPNLINRLKEEWNNLDPVDPLRRLLSDAIDALAEQPSGGATSAQLPFGVGGGLAAIKTLLSRDPCVHANTAIQMIDAMLAEQPAQQQEPIWFWTHPTHGRLYKQPPAQRPWVGLTDEEIDNMVEVTDLSGTYYYDDLYAVVRAAEAKLRSKNEDRN